MTVLTVREVADRLRISPDAVYGAVTRGELRAIRIGRAYRIREEAYEEWIQRQEAR